MRFHDYHLRGYSVSEGGCTIVLDLVYDYPDQPIRESQIEFTGVWLHHFIHTSAAIITDIIETPISKLLSDHETQIKEWHRQQCVSGWHDSVEESVKKLETEGLSGWSIYSAIGFSGFVIGKDTRQKGGPCGPADAALLTTDFC